MPLNFQNVPVVFTEGLDKTDPYILSPGKLTTLQNMVFEDAQTISMRAGQKELLLTPAVPSTPAPFARTNPSFTGTPYRMAQNQSALMLEGSAGLFSRAAYTPNALNLDAPSMLQARAPAGGSAVGRPDFVRATAETDYVGTFAYPEGALIPVYGTYPGGQSHDMARIENYDGNGRTMSMYAWVENSTTTATSIHIRAFDEGESGTTNPRTARTQVFEFIIATTNPASSVRVLASATDFFVMSVDTTTNIISVRLRLTAATGAVAYPTYTATSTGTAQIFDAQMDATSGSIVIAYQNGAATMRLAFLDAAASAESFGTTVAITGALETLSIVYGLQVLNRTYNVLYTCTATPTVIRGNFITHGGTTGAEVLIYTAATTVRRITGVDYSSAATDFAVFYDTVGTGGEGAVFQLSVVKIGFAATDIGGTAGIAQNSQLYARPQAYGLVIQVPVFTGIFDPTYPAIFVVQAQAVSTGFYPAAVQKTVTSARIHWGAAGNLTTVFSPFLRLPSTAKETITGDMILPATRWGAQAISGAAAVSGIISSETQLWQARLNFTSQDLGYVEANRDTILAGSCPQSFDGSFFEETGFNHRPVIASAAASGAAGDLSTGTYSVCCTYTRRDSRGNLCESMPSEVVTFAAVAGVSDQYTVTVLGYGITSLPNVGIRIYRSIAGESTMYLDGRATANVLSVGETDTNITANTRVPTDGGVLPNEPMPPCRVVVEHDDRLWCAGAEAGDTIYFSQPISDDIAPEWNRLLKRRIPKNAGRVVNMVSLDDKLVIFCEKRIGFIYGDGPTPTGAQDGYSEFIEAVSGYAIPWGEPHSIVRATDGVWFRCGFGFRLLGRNMQVVQAGTGDLASELDAAVASLTVVRALISTTAQQVRFYMSDATVYVFDMSYRQWSQFTNASAVDCTSIGDDFYRLASTPKLFIQRKGFYTDAGTMITGTVTTAWLSFAGLQGFQRVSRVMLLGWAPALDTFDITLDAAFNYDEITFENLRSGAAPRLNNAIQFEAQPTTQKCESMRLRISIFPQTVAGPETFRLTTVNLLVGLKKGRYKLPSANKV